MDNIDFKDENTHLKKELAKLRKQNKKLCQKLERTKNKAADLKKELKKNEGLTIKLNKEQEQSLSNRLKDTDILKLLLE